MNKEELIEELNTSFSRISSIIESLWGTKELDDYFKNTLLIDRANRQGFPEEVWRTISKLQQIHEVTND